MSQTINLKINKLGKHLLECENCMSKFTMIITHLVGEKK